MVKVYLPQKYEKGTIIFTLSGKIYDFPSRETIHIGNHKHIYILDQKSIKILLKILV